MKMKPEPIHHGNVIAIAMQFVSITLLVLFCASFSRNKYFPFMYCTLTFPHSLCGQIATPRFAKSILNRAWISLSLSIYTHYRPLYNIWYCTMVLDNILGVIHCNLHYTQHQSHLQILLQTFKRLYSLGLFSSFMAPQPLADQGLLIFAASR
jgi:hypothetical protein